MYQTQNIPEIKSKFDLQTTQSKNQMENYDMINWTHGVKINSMKLRVLNLIMVLWQSKNKMEQEIKIQ